MAKTIHALVSDLKLPCKLKLEVKYYALVSVFNLTCNLNVAGFNQQVQVLFTSVRFSNVRKHRYEIQDKFQVLLCKFKSCLPMYAP